ncbi:DUF6266 family protein [Pedobacter gandavensis]|uniref:DUF6266 family protein n=1 Tax=Pedobacter gandavensis TaxID=2679963 RepID=UPI002931B509|nr:DUF6266 family protein [Pedobacter gandavensis]
MGKLFAGPWMDVRGKVGNNVGRYVNGENIITVKPHKSNKPPTANQLNHQELFGKINSIVVHWAEQISQGFGRLNSKQTARQLAVEYNFERAITGTSPNREIDYSKFMFSRGSLPGAQQLKVINSLDDSYYLTFTWTKDVNDKEAGDTDFINFMVHCPATGRNTGLTKVVKRSALTWELAIPYSFAGEELECYVNFTTADGKKVSDSQHAGTLLKA